MELAHNLVLLAFCRNVVFIAFFKLFALVFGGGICAGYAHARNRAFNVRVDFTLNNAHALIYGAHTPADKQGKNQYDGNTRKHDKREIYVDERQQNKRADNSYQR